MAEKRDYYEVLEVEKTADAKEIKAAYRKKAVKFHPDKNPDDPETERKFKEATEAYSVLSDADKRARYDRFGHAAVGGSPASGGGFDPSQFTDFGDILGDLFGFGDMFGGGGRRRRGPSRGSDLRYDLEVSLVEAYTGSETKIRVPRSESCGTCSGSGAKSASSIATCEACGGRGKVIYRQGLLTVSRACGTCSGSGQTISDPCGDCSGRGKVDTVRELNVKIPPGVDTGSQLRLTSEGEAGSKGGPPGDLFIVLHVRPDKNFEREGDDLHTLLQISFPKLALGAEVDVATLAGDKSLKIPAGTPADKVLRMKGLGMPSVRRPSHHGDLNVHLRVEVPKKLGGAAKELLKKYQQTTETDTEEEEGLFEKVRNLF